ncbi:MAG: hypothetical protein Fur0010_28540 [Bdellovibrio sp.]
MNLKKSPDQIKEELKLLQNAANLPLLDTDNVEEVKVNIRPDSSVSPAMFVPDPLIPGGYKAHPITIRAMKKDLFFVSSEGFADLEQIVPCKGCNRDIDAQFWNFCPYCEAPLSS